MARVAMLDANGYISPTFHRFYSNSFIISILVLVTEEVWSKLIHLALRATNWFRKIKVIEETSNKIKSLINEEKDILKRIVTGYTFINDVIYKNKNLRATT